MSEIDQTESAAAEMNELIGRVRNIGDPIRFKDVEMSGFASEHAQAGQQIGIWTRMAVTSDEPRFHRFSEGFVDAVHYLAQQAGMAIRPDRTNTLLFVIKADKAAELWLDTAAVSVSVAVKRAMKAGQAVFESDIADITAMHFPCVNIESTDRVLCIFREGWSFGFAFDFNPEGNLDINAFNQTLGRLLRELRYRHLYGAIADKAVFGRIIASGWFPFVEIISNEFKDLQRHCEAGFDLSQLEAAMVAKFDMERMNRIYERWIEKPHFASKAELLKVAIDAYNRQEPITVIKILLTEIEGILNEAYKASHNGQGAKLKDLLQFAVDSAEHKTGQSNTLFFPAAFIEYLSVHTFANFDPVAQAGTAGSRHAVGHGAAEAATYTMPRALQAILTLDQFAFYT